MKAEEILSVYLLLFDFWAFLEGVLFVSDLGL